MDNKDLKELEAFESHMQKGRYGLMALVILSIVFVGALISGGVFLLISSAINSFFGG